jgi:hypothetical protein
LRERERKRGAPQKCVLPCSVASTLLCLHRRRLRLRTAGFDCLLLRACNVHLPCSNFVVPLPWSRYIFFCAIVFCPLALYYLHASALVRYYLHASTLVRLGVVLKLHITAFLSLSPAILLHYCTLVCPFSIALSIQGIREPASDSAYVSIRQHASRNQRACKRLSIRQHTSAYVSMRQGIKEPASD